MLKSFLFAASAFALAATAHAAPATLQQYWDGQAHFARQGTIITHTGGGDQITIGPGDAAHPAGIWYHVFSQVVGTNPACPDIEGDGVRRVKEMYIQRSFDEGVTWGDETRIIGVGGQGTGYECQVSDGTMTFSNGRWDFMYQCVAAGTDKTWHTCYSRRNGADPMAGWEHFGWKLDLDGAGATACANGAHCRADLNSRPGGMPARPMRDCGTPDVIGAVGGGNVAISFHCSNGTMGARFMATTSDAFNGVNVYGGDAFLHPADSDRFSRMAGYGGAWQGFVDFQGVGLAAGTAGYSAGVGHASTIQDGGIWYTVFEAMDYKPTLSAGQQWTIGMVRNGYLGATEWDPIPRGNPIMSDKFGIALSAGEGYPAYARLFKDKRTPANIYFAANHNGGIRMYRLVAGAGGDFGGFDGDLINTVKQNEDGAASSLAACTADVAGKVQTVLHIGPNHPAYGATVAQYRGYCAPDYGYDAASRIKRDAHTAGGCASVIGNTYKTELARVPDEFEQNDWYASQCTAANLGNLDSDLGAAIHAEFIRPVQVRQRFWSNGWQDYYLGSTALERLVAPNGALNQVFGRKLDASGHLVQIAYSQSTGWQSADLGAAATNGNFPVERIAVPKNTADRVYTVRSDNGHLAGFFLDGATMRWNASEFQTQPPSPLLDITASDDGLQIWGAYAGGIWYWGWNGSRWLSWQFSNYGTKRIKVGTPESGKLWALGYNPGTAWQGVPMMWQVQSNLTWQGPYVSQGGTWFQFREFAISTQGDSIWGSLAYQPGIGRIAWWSGAWHGEVHGTWSATDITAYPTGGGWNSIVTSGGARQFSNNYYDPNAANGWPEQIVAVPGVAAAPLSLTFNQYWWHFFYTTH